MLRVVFFRLFVGVFSLLLRLFGIGLGLRALGSRFGVAMACVGFSVVRGMVVIIVAVSIAIAMAFWYLIATGGGNSTVAAWALVCGVCGVLCVDFEVAAVFGCTY